MTTPQPSLMYTSNNTRQMQQIDLPISKPPSSTLVDLLKQKRSSPPPVSMTVTNSSSVTSTRQRKQNSTAKPQKKSSKKAQVPTKQMPVNNTLLSSISVSANMSIFFPCESSVF